ncbi:hypothetical protein Tco_0897383 [Tanacetum coccineum]
MFLSRRCHSLALRLHPNSKMKVYSKHIDWGQVKITKDIMERDKEAVAKENEDMTLSIMKVTNTPNSLQFVLYRNSYPWNKWKCEDEIAYVILEDLWLKYEKDDKGKGKEAEYDHLKVNKDDKVNGKVHDIQNRLGKLEGDLARGIKARQVDDLDTLDFENIIKKLEEDFGWLLKAKRAKEAKKSKKAKKVKLTKEAKKAKKKELKPKEAKKAKKAELKAKEAMMAELKAKKAKEAMLAELKAKKANEAKEAMLPEVVQISSDEDDDEDPTASTSTRSRAPITSTSIPQAASIAPRYVLALFALNAPNAPPPSTTRKRKST